MDISWVGAICTPPWLIGLTILSISLIIHELLFFRNLDIPQMFILQIKIIKIKKLAKFGTMANLNFSPITWYNHAETHAVGRHTSIVPIVDE